MENHNAGFLRMIANSLIYEFETDWPCQYLISDIAEGLTVV